MTETQIRLFDEVNNMLRYYQSIVESTEWDSSDHEQAIFYRDLAGTLFTRVADIYDYEFECYLEDMGDEWYAFQATIGCAHLAGLSYDELKVVGDFCDCEEEDEGECKRNKLDLAYMFAGYKEGTR